MFAVPFFFVGVCVSYTLIASEQSPGVVAVERVFSAKLTKYF